MGDRPYEAAAVRSKPKNITVDLDEFERFQSRQSANDRGAAVPDLVLVSDSPKTGEQPGKQSVTFKFGGKEYRAEYDPSAANPADRIKIVDAKTGQPVDPATRSRFHNLEVKGSKLSFTRTRAGAEGELKVEIDLETGAVSVSDARGKITRYANGVRSYEWGPEGNRVVTTVRGVDGKEYKVDTVGSGNDERITRMDGLPASMDPGKGPITFDRDTGRVVQKLDGGRVIVYTPGGGTIDTVGNRSTVTGKDGITKTTYEESEKDNGGTRIKERTFERTPFGEKVKVTYDAQGRPASITDTAGKPIAGLEVVDGEIVYTQGRVRIKLDEYLMPVELQEKDASGLWRTAVKVGDNRVVSLRIDESRNAIWKYDDGRTCALTNSGTLVTQFRDTQVGRVVRRDFTNPPGVSLAIEVGPDGTEKVVGQFRAGSQAMEPLTLRSGESVDPLTGGIVRIETVGVNDSSSPTGERAIRARVTTFSGPVAINPDGVVTDGKPVSGVVIKQELGDSGDKPRENGVTEVVLPGPNDSLTTSTVRRNTNEGTTTEVVFKSKDATTGQQELRGEIERDKDGRIVAIIRPLPPTPNGPASQRITFDYDDNGKLTQISLDDGRKFVLNPSDGKWYGYRYDNGKMMELPGAAGIQLDPRLNQQTGEFSMNLAGFAAVDQRGDRSAPVVPRDVPSGPPGDAPTKDADYVRQVRCQPKLIGFDPVTGKPIWRFSAHPNYVPGAACTRWQFAPQVNEKGIMTDQGYRMNFSRTTGPDGRIQVQVAEFPECPNGVAWKMSDGSVVTGVHKIETRWDNEKGCYVTTLFGKNGQPLKQMYVSEDGNEYDPVRRIKIDDGLDNPRVRAGANDTVPFDARRQELSDKVGNGMATYDNTSSNDPQTKAVAKQGARDAIGDYRRAIYQEIERIRQEVYAQGGDANMLAAAFKQKLEAKGLLAELKRLDDAEARLR